MRQWPRRVGWRVGAMLMGLYLLTWLATQAIGTAQVRRTVIEAMLKPEQRSGFEDVTRKEAAVRRGEKVFSCRARAWTPFLVRVDYGWGAGPVTGGGGSRLYVWLMGYAVEVADLSDWAQ